MTDDATQTLVANALLFKLERDEARTEAADLLAVVHSQDTALDELTVELDELQAAVRAHLASLPRCWRVGCQAPGLWVEHPERPFALCQEHRHHRDLTPVAYADTAATLAKLVGP